MTSGHPFEFVGCKDHSYVALSSCRWVAFVPPETEVLLRASKSQLECSRIDSSLRLLHIYMHET
jgi:hypothetical protein